MTDWTAVDDPVPGHRRRGDGPSVVLLHGFTQTGLSWSPVADLLDSRFDLFAPDAPGHGRSDELRSTISGYAARLADELPPSVYVGYSMGGRTALHVAIRHPERVRGLVLIGATPGLDSEQDRADRRAADEELAARLLASTLDVFLHDWLTQPLFSTLPVTAWNLDDRRRNSSRGLSSSLRLAGTGSQDSLWTRLGEISCPTVLVTGERDVKFTAIAERMTTLMMATTEHLVIPGLGHAVHLEDPNKVADIVNDLTRRAS